MGVKESHQERAYDFFSFLCMSICIYFKFLLYSTIVFTGDVGGIIGLWLGGSIISIFEIVDITCFSNMSRFFNRKTPRNSLTIVKETRDSSIAPRDCSVAPSEVQIQENGVQPSTHSASNYHSCRESLSFVEKFNS